MKLLLLHSQTFKCKNILFFIDIYWLSGNNVIVQKLLDLGVDVNMKDKDYIKQDYPFQRFPFPFKLAY